MLNTHNLGYPRIGAKRELKFALERYWKSEINETELKNTAKQLRQQHWQQQSELDLLPVGDFSLYDQVLDMSFALGNIPQRVKHIDNTLDQYFTVARGRSTSENTGNCVNAGEMTKWFDSNYHYIVPELSAGSTFSVNPQHLLKQINEAQALGINAKPVIIGPITYLYLSKIKDSSDKLTLLDNLLTSYSQLLAHLANTGIEWVQIDEPILVTELSRPWQQGVKKAYQYLKQKKIKLLLTCYFGSLQENLPWVCKLPIQGLHLDAINAKNEVASVIKHLPPNTVLSLGVIDGRNIWKTDLNKTLDFLEPIYQQRQQNLWLAPSCSLLHIPVDLDNEKKLAPDIKRWLAFAQQKLDELNILADALKQGRTSVTLALRDNANAIHSKARSTKIHKQTVQQKVAAITTELGQRHSPYQKRISLQRKQLKLPLYPTSTIGSFPQTAHIRQIRKQYRHKAINQTQYHRLLQEEIKHCVYQQEQLGLDVLVHGEAERNDMVEYFGEQLNGYAFSQFGWVQSYGSRCVKPPIIFGDISRPQPMTVEWIQYAQSLTKKPMKGMLTGPVTLLNWSFVRNDQSRKQTCLQLALAIREEVLDLEKAGIKIIQIDEAALREGLPLRKKQWQHYLDWAIQAFRISANGVKDSTQIHTHMCYSEFNDIIHAIADMDADVITIETSRSDKALLNAFKQFNYPNDIGPGVYDIHSPNIPSTEAIINLMQEAAKQLPKEQLWINPDCGLKTRAWHETKIALKNMVEAANYLRQADQLNKPKNDTL